MEEKNIPEQDVLPVSPSVSEPEATEVPVLEALTFTSGEALPEQPTEAAPGSAPLWMCGNAWYSPFLPVSEKHRQRRKKLFHKICKKELHFRKSMLQ